LAYPDISIVGNTEQGIERREQAEKLKSPQPPSRRGSGLTPGARRGSNSPSCKEGLG